MKLIAVYIGGFIGFILGCAGFMLSDKIDHEVVFNDAMLCEARGGAWVHNAKDPLCMTPDEGLLELVDGSFVAYTSADPWEQPQAAPLEGRELVGGEVSIAQEESAIYAAARQGAMCEEVAMETYEGRVAKVDFSSWPDAAKYRTAITKDVKRGVNFAGSYIVSTWGCGRKKSDACVGHAIIDARTGKIVLYDVIGRTGADFSRESNVFSVTLQSGEEKVWSVQGDELVECRDISLGEEGTSR